MNPATRAQLRSLDLALLALLDERARLLSAVDAGDPGRAAGIDDMLRRHEGPFAAESITAVFSAIDEHCRRFARERGGSQVSADDGADAEART
jgi:chorismate mutase